MNLLAIRTRVATLSGRWDLVTDFPAADYSDNGLDAFIQAAQRFLEGRPEFSFASVRGQRAVVDLSLVQGTVEYELTEAARVVERIQLINTADDEAPFLVKLDYEELLNDYSGKAALTDHDQGVPCFYALRPYRDLSSDTDDEKIKHRLVIMPPPKAAYTAKVHVVAQNTELSGDTDTNIFTLEYPDVLVFATLWHLESAYRNREGANDHLTHLNALLEPLFHDQVRQSVSDEVTEMNRLW